MVNISKIKTLAKSKGITQVYICSELGVKGSYLTDVANGKNSMSDERIYKVASILNTSYGYLTDQTDDPNPAPSVSLSELADMAESLEERIHLEVLDKLAAMPEDRRETLHRLFRLPDDEFDRALEMLELLWRK